MPAGFYGCAMATRAAGAQVIPGLPTTGTLPAAAGFWRGGQGSPAPEATQVAVHPLSQKAHSLSHPRFW